MKVEEMFAGVPGLGQVAEDLPVPFKTIASTDLKPGDWLHLVPSATKPSRPSRRSTALYRPAAPQGWREPPLSRTGR